MTQRNLVIATVVLAGALLLPKICSAGLGPENVIVVVNAESYESRTLANAYVELRNVPSANVIMLKGVPEQRTISREDFKTKLLRPIMSQIESRRLVGQARVIAYSAGFPTSVNIKSDTAKLTNPQLRQLQRGIASINGLTFFYRYLFADDTGYLGLAANLYSRGAFKRNFQNPFSDAESKTKFSNADTFFRRGKYADAAVRYQELFEQAPTVAPLALRAAESYAQSGDLTEAKSLIIKAVQAGWTSKTWIAESESLAPLMNDPPLSSLANRLSDAPIELQEPVGFSSRVAWMPTGHRTNNLNMGVPYMLSCTLGVIHPNGSTLPQAIEILERSATADRTYPDGEFWFLISKDVRTKTRILGFEAAKDWLRHLGMKTDSPFGAVPNKAGRCAGMMLGSPTLNLDNRKWEFVPGAIADNLTSFGALYDNPKQTKLNELLHAGAAMSSGTVTEPFSLQAKFPLPIMYGYFASGVAALEAFYLSVSCPYQLLIVGDPLAQPYARPPTDEITLTPSAMPKRGTRLARVASKSSQPPVQPGAMEMYIEGKLATRTQPVSEMVFELPKTAAGEIDVRVVLISRDPIQARSSYSDWILQGETDPARRVQSNRVPTR